MDRGCLGAVFGCVGAVVGCIGVAFGCIGAAVGCIGAAVGCIGATFGCMGAAVGCIGAAFCCIVTAFGCIGAAFGCICNILQHMLHIAGWLAGPGTPGIPATRPVGGNFADPRGPLATRQYDCIQDTGYRRQDT